MIPNNEITLLQNGEAYFPALEAELDRAVHEIYLESYIFKYDSTGTPHCGSAQAGGLSGGKNPCADRWIRFE